MISPGLISLRVGNFWFQDGLFVWANDTWVL